MRLAWALSFVLVTGCAGKFGDVEPVETPPYDSGSVVDSPFDDTGNDDTNDAYVAPDASKPLPGEGTLTPLSFRVIDAEYSLALDRIVAISTTPARALHVYDPATGVDSEVTLPTNPVAVSVSPDGKTAAVGHDARVTFVDLTTATVTKSCATTCDVSDIVLAGNGRAYVFPRTDQWVAVHSVRASDCVESNTSEWAIYAGDRAKLHPDGNRIYDLDPGLSPQDLERVDITVDPPKIAYDSPYHGDYPMCGDLFMSEDGARIFTACGKVFRASDAKSEDMTYNGSLESVGTIAHLTHSRAGRLVVSIPRIDKYAYPAPPPDFDAKLLVHDDEFLTLKRAIGLRGFDAPKPGVAHGRFVFVHSSGATIHAIVQADPELALTADFAVVTIKL